MSRPALISGLPAHLPIAVARRATCVRASASREVVHDHAGLAIYLSGATRLWMRADYTLTRGHVLLVPEGVPHYASGASEGELLGIALCSPCMRGAWGEHLRDAFASVRRGGTPVRQLEGDALVELESLAAALERELALRRPHHELAVDGLMSQITAHVARASPTRVRTDAGEGLPLVVAEALDHIESNATRAISLRDVARAVGRSPAHLAVLVKKHTGRTVVEWITHARMALARQLLLTSDDGVDAIAAQVGFASASHFHRRFRRLHALAPGEWRREHRAAR